MEKKKSFQIKIISYILSFILSILIFACCAIPVFYFTFLSANSITKNLESINYYEGVEAYSVESAGDILLPTGLPNTILEGAFSYEDIGKIMEGTIHGKNTEWIYDSMKNNTRTILKENIYNYLTENEISLEDVLEEDIDEIIEAVVADYTGNTSFPFIAQLIRIQGIYTNVMKIILIGSAILSVVIIFFLYKLNKWKHRVIHFGAISLSGAALMTTIIPLVIRIWKFYERIHLSPEYMYDFMVTHVQNGLNVFIICGSIVLTISIVLGIMAERIRKKLIHKTQKRNSKREARAEVPPETESNSEEQIKLRLEKEIELEKEQLRK